MSSFETSSGGTPLKANKEYYEGGTIPWLRSGEVSKGEIKSSELFITQKGLFESSAKIFPINTVLVAMYGATAGQIGILRIEAATNQAICGIFPNENIIPEFLYYLLQAETDHLVQISYGGAQPNISQKIIKNLQIPLPSIEVQEKILEQIDLEQSLIANSSQLIEIFSNKIEEKIAEIWGEGDRGLGYGRSL